MSFSDVQSDQVPQEPVEGAPRARCIEGERLDPFLMLPVDLFRSKILPLLLAKPFPIANARSIGDKQRRYTEFCENHHNIAQVSKQWNTILGDFVNTNTLSEIISPRDLAELKTKVFALDLSSPLISVRFMELVREERRRYDDDEDEDAWPRDMTIDLP